MYITTLIISSNYLVIVTNLMVTSGDFTTEAIIMLTMQLIQILVPNPTIFWFPVLLHWYLEIEQGALEQATGRVLMLRIERPRTEGFC